MHQKLDLPEGWHSTSVGGQMRNLLCILPRLLHNWMSYQLLGMQHWIPGTLCVKVRTLHLELGTLVLKL
jgi:hypothetical protein